MMRALILPTACLLLTACAADISGPFPSQQSAASLELPPAQLPSYRVGDQVTWSNGQTETVVAVDGEVVNWRDQDGNSYSSYRNFVLPSLAWDYPTSRARTEIPVAADTLWPLAPGKDAHFKVHQRLVAKIHNSETAYFDEWGCRVIGAEKVKVKLGRFDTYKVRCSRFWQGSNVGEITWNYAPALGRVVRRSWTGADEPEELIAIGHGAIEPKAEQAAAKLRQRGLESLASGAKAVGKTSWMQAAVQPRATFVTSKGAVCRDFLQTIVTRQGRATSAGTACRAEDGKWQVVDKIKTKED
jgi:hypothetical protein